MRELGHNLEALVDLLSRLIAIPSVHPEHTDDRAIAGEERMAEFFAAYLERLGFRVTRDLPRPGRPNVIARFGPARPRRTILWESHLDTVGVAGFHGDPFGARREGGRLYGRGACDTKGALAAALLALTPPALERLAESGVALVYAGTMGEERGNEGARHLAASGLRADEALILEPTALRIVHAHKGALWFAVDVLGVAAHGSNPEHGRNAITGMRHVMDLLQRIDEQDAARVRHDLLGRPTLSIGSIRGGIAVNVVPDACTIEVDRRTVPGEDHAAWLRRVEEGLAGLRRQGWVHDARLRILTDSRPFQTRADSALVRRLEKSCARAGQPAVLEGAAWYSDAGPLAAVCSEVVVFGPGDIRQAHAADEHIELESLARGHAILCAFLALAAEDHGGVG